MECSILNAEEKNEAGRGESETLYVEVRVGEFKEDGQEYPAI